jgi:hypothetical protein
MPDWYYSQGNTQRGPVPTGFLIDSLRSGALAPSDLVWRDGMVEWAQAANVAELSGTFRGAVPPPVLPTVVSPANAFPNATSNSRSAIKTCLLVSAIGNIVIGLFWLSSCFGVVFTVPMVILCIFEFTLYAKIDDLPVPVLVPKAKTLGIFEIIVGLANIVSLVCGILNLIHTGKVTRTFAGQVGR